jgi:hypothetical protein
MTKSDSSLDLIANLALTGAAALMLVRPKQAAQIAASPFLSRTLEAARATARRLTPRSAPSRSSRKTRELARLISRYAPSARAGPQDVARIAGRKLNGSSAILALSVLADSAVEHYRGSFENRAMYTPLVASALTLGASLFGTVDARAERHVLRDSIYAAAAATGFAGLAFHSYNILKRPGGVSWHNVFYAAPIGAPMALALAGLLGCGAERVRDTLVGRPPAVLGLPAGRILAAVAAAGLAGTAGEAGLLHFRGAYQNPAMVAPVTVPPVASVLLGAAALRPSRMINHLARWWLRLTALLGFAGVGFHAYGVSRGMGGWRNWSQNGVDGPPLPAPPSFTGLALAGLAALSLIEEKSDG